MERFPTWLIVVVRVGGPTLLAVLLALGLITVDQHDALVQLLGLKPLDRDWETFPC